MKIIMMSQKFQTVVKCLNLKKVQVAGVYRSYHSARGRVHHGRQSVAGLTLTTIHTLAI